MASKIWITDCVFLISHPCRWMSHFGTKLSSSLFSWMYLYKCKYGFIPTWTPSTMLFTSPSYDFGIRHVAFSIPQMLSIEPKACGRACFFLSSLQLLDVSGESAGLWRGFLLDCTEIKKPISFLTTEGLSCCINQSQSLQTWRTLKWCLYAFLTVDISDCKLWIIEYCIISVETVCLWGRKPFKTALAYLIEQCYTTYGAFVCDVSYRRQIVMKIWPDELWDTHCDYINGKVTQWHLLKAW